MATREHALGVLQRELRHARDVREDAYATQLEAEIRRLSQGSGDNPAREQASRPRPARRTPRR